MAEQRDNLMDEPEEVAGARQENLTGVEQLKIVDVATKEAENKARAKIENNSNLSFEAKQTKFEMLVQKADVTGHFIKEIVTKHSFVTFATISVVSYYLFMDVVMPNVEIAREAESLAWSINSPNYGEAIDATKNAIALEFINLVIMVASGAATLATAGLGIRNKWNDAREKNKEFEKAKG